MIRFAIAFTVGVLAATPVLSAGGVYCDSPTDETVSAFLTVGRVPGFAVVGARIDAAGQSWDVLQADGTTPIVLGQGAMWGELIVADFTDPNAERIVISLRVVRAETDEAAAAAGTLKIPGVGVWPVVCEVD